MNFVGKAGQPSVNSTNSNVVLYLVNRTEYSKLRHHTRFKVSGKPSKLSVLILSRCKIVTNSLASGSSSSSTLPTGVGVDPSARLIVFVPLAEFKKPNVREAEYGCSPRFSSTLGRNDLGQE